jgi:hypothetical protein
MVSVSPTGVKILSVALIVSATTMALASPSWVRTLAGAPIASVVLGTRGTVFAIPSQVSIPHVAQIVPATAMALASLSWVRPLGVAMTARPAVLVVRRMAFVRPRRVRLLCAALTARPVGMVCLMVMNCAMI